MSSQFARLRGALDRVGTTTPGTIVGVFAEDLTAIMNHYVEVVREAAELKAARAQPAQAGQDFTEQLREVAKRAGTTIEHDCYCGRKWKHTSYGWASTAPEHLWAAAGQVLGDEEIDAVYIACRIGGVQDFARAIEQAVMAKRVPMTPEETDAAMKLLFYPARNRAFIDGVEAAELHHGIVGEKGGAT